MTSTDVLGLGLTLLLNGSKWCTNIAGTVVPTPFTVVLTNDATVWSYVYTDIISPLFNTVSPLEISSQVTPTMAMIAIWGDMGYRMVTYIAALQSTSDDYYDVAKANGANWWQRVKGIAFPLIVPAIISNVTPLIT